MKPMKAYIPHYTPLTNRYKSIVGTCNELNLQPQIVSAYDREKLPNKPGESKQDRILWNSMLELIKPVVMTNAGIENYGSEVPQWAKYRALKGAEISLTYKHFLCLLQIASSKEPGLVFEDDILTKPTSRYNLTRALELLGTEADYIDLGGGCKLPISDTDTKLGGGGIFLRTKPPRSRTTAAYAVTAEGALTLAEGLFPCIFPLDWSFQYIFLKKHMRVVWTEPSCLLHGSQDSMQSSIQ